MGAALQARQPPESFEIGVVHAADFEHVVRAHLDAIALALATRSVDDGPQERRRNLDRFLGPAFRALAETREASGGRFGATHGATTGGADGATPHSSCSEGARPKASIALAVIGGSYHGGGAAARHRRGACVVVPPSVLAPTRRRTTHDNDDFRYRNGMTSHEVQHSYRATLPLTFDCRAVQRRMKSGIASNPASQRDAATRSDRWGEPRKAPRT